MSTSSTTTDHDRIRKWAEARGGVPTVVKGTESKGDPESGVLRIHFPQHSDANDDFKEISWDDFFEVFDERDLAFLYGEDKNSRFHKFVSNGKQD